MDAPLRPLAVEHMIFGICRCGRRWQRLKKRKLILRDRIRAIEDQLTPDIIA